MSELSQFDLISGVDIPYNGVCVLHPPHLEDIRKLGYEKYSKYIMFLITDINKYFEVSKINVSAIKDISNLCIFDIWISDISTREYFKDILSFFISGDIEFVDSYKAFKVICNDTIGIINRNNYSEIASAILKLNCIKQEKTDDIAFRDEASRKLYEQFQKAKKTGELKTEDKNFSFANLISSVAVYGNGYNLSNIWELTIYQLYDQFYRLSSKFQLDIIGTRWAAWGKEKFDFEVWHNNINLLK